MRLRLWHRLFIALAALSVIALAGFAAWQQQNFRSGFLGYLDKVALERLQAATTRLAEAYRDNGNRWDFLRDDRRRFAELIEPRALFRNGPAGALPPPQPPAERPWPPPDAFRDPDREHGPPHGPPDLMARLALFDAAGQFVVGANELPANSGSIPIRLDDQTIGSLHLAHLPELSGTIDVAFAREQMRTALFAGIAVLVGALVLAFALARWLLAPVRTLAEATRALAAGDYARRIEAARNDELGALAGDFNHLASSLERAREARRSWGADIAHELRTPLSVLRGEIHALQDGVRAPSAQAFDSLNTECERLGSLIEDLYQLSLADAGALEYRFEWIDFGEIVQDCADAQRAACAKAGLAIETAIEPAPPVRGDARRLAQLVDNLLVNARRYTDAPGRIRVALVPDEAGVELRIEDTAPGVAADALPRLFDRLYRVDASRSRAAGGAGLGLSICRAIVQAHGGRIDAEPSPLGGLCVVAWLPHREEP